MVHKLLTSFWQYHWEIAGTESLVILQVCPLCVDFLLTNVHYFEHLCTCLSSLIKEFSHHSIRFTTRHRFTEWVTKLQSQNAVSLLEIWLNSKFYGFKWRNLMPVSTDCFDVWVSWDQVACHPGNKFCMVMPNIFSIIITGLFSYMQNVDQFTRTEQKVSDSIEVQGSR